METSLSDLAKLAADDTETTRQSIGLQYLENPRETKVVRFILLNTCQYDNTSGYGNASIGISSPRKANRYSLLDQALTKIDLKLIHM